jgi:uncharacterized protein (DUF4415 family)
MKDEYDFSNGVRGPVVAVPRGKTRITIRLDEDVVQWFKNRVSEAGGGDYQTALNSALRAYIERNEAPFESVLRRVIREELQANA